MDELGVWLVQGQVLQPCHKNSSSEWSALHSQDQSWIPCRSDHCLGLAWLSPWSNKKGDGKESLGTKLAFGHVTVVLGVPPSISSFLAVHWFHLLSTFVNNLQTIIYHYCWWRSCFLHPSCRKSYLYKYIWSSYRLCYVRDNWLLAYYFFFQLANEDSQNEINCTLRSCRCN